MSTPMLVLVVDDEKAVRETLAYSLENAGYNVLKAVNGEEAITIAQNRQPDIILLDVKMPGLTGFETARILRTDEKTKSIPILFLTGEAKDVASMETGFEIGADDYLTKAQSTKEIMLRIEHAIRRYSQKRP